MEEHQVYLLYRDDLATVLAGSAWRTAMDNDTTVQ